MPQADGLEMIKMLKEAGNPAKFILLSGYADFEYARRGMQLGVQFYINKPVEEEELRDCVCQVMEDIRTERAKFPGSGRPEAGGSQPDAGKCTAGYS